MTKLFATCTVLTVASLIILSCKKSSSTTTTPSSTSPTTSTTSAPTVLFMISNLFDNNTSNDSSAGASASPVSIIGSVSLGTVTLNSIDTLINSSGSYSSNTLLPVSGKPVWKISGGITASAFSYTITKTIPHVENLHLSVSSFSKSSNLVLTHATITADTIKYTITDGAGVQVTKSVSGSASGYTFIPSTMTHLNAGSGAFIEVVGLTYEYSVQGGKNMLFLNSSQYTKDNITINN